MTFKMYPLNNGSTQTSNDPNVEYYTHEINPPKYSKGDRVLIIDADILAYKLASKGDDRVCMVSRDGKTKQFKNKTEFKELCKKNGWDYNTFEKVDTLIPKDVSVIIGNLKAAVGNILRATNCNKYELYIGGSENFRLDIPLPDQYKSSRKEALRPTYLTDCKEYLIRYKGGKKIKGRETDDYVQQRMYELYKEGVDAILYSNDKDSRQPLHHDIVIYNPDDKSIKTYRGGLGDLWLQPNGDVKGSGLKWLMFQCMLYDKIDTYMMNSHYLVSYSEKSFYKDFKDLKTEVEVLNKVVSLLKKMLPEITAYKSWNGIDMQLSWLELAELYFQCAYMRIKDNDKTTFESLLQEYGVDY